jgi:hypothetical protein
MEATLMGEAVWPAASIRGLAIDTHWEDALRRVVTARSLTALERAAEA